MGTNYYFYEQPPCPHCNREYPPRHIGKSSAGWVFALHVYPEDDIHDLYEWVKLWSKYPNSYIKDEYLRIIPKEDMIEIIGERSFTREENFLSQDWISFLALNQALEGPNGLVRSIVDGKRIIKHGDGTWDCHVGEFS